MHPNPVFHDVDTDRNLAFARDRGFGVLAAQGAGAPLLSHVPFLLSADGALAELHLVRSNPIARALSKSLPVTLAVSGGDSYVSPDWYGIPDQVPTWNYIAVHLTGTLELRPTGELRDLLDRQSAAYEDRLLPKAPWTTDKMTPAVMDKLMRMIVPCRMRITGVDGTWKLSQNKPDAVRGAAAEHMTGYGFGSDVDVLAAQMLSARRK